jgi:hypothetical protein
MMTEAGQGRAVKGRADAETIAVETFNFIVADVDRIIRFLNITGLQPETIRESARSAHFLQGVLDYVIKDDELLRTIHKELGIWPATILAASEHLTPEPKSRPESDPASKKPEPSPQLPRRSLFE